MNGYRILVTGSRHWTDTRTIAIALADVIHANDHEPSLVLVHGGAPGADTIADQLWRLWSPRECLEEPQVFRADWFKYGKAAGPMRNQEMVNAGADVCLAFPLGMSRGTRDCMGRARAAGIRVVSYEPKEQP